MGEAAPCLMRSASHPLFASREFKEGDPLRALTTSVSFGRFMTEPLDWERWSSFSHNRIREDVQKHSRPGAVAEKKAFFEAYFNNFASKKSAKPTRKENKPPLNYCPPTNVSPVTISRTPENQSPTVDTDENTCNRRAEPEITSNYDVSSPSTNLVTLKTKNVVEIISSASPVEQEKASTAHVSSPIVSSTEGGEPEISSKQDVSSPFTDPIFPEIGNVDDIIPAKSHAEHEKSSTSLVFSGKGAKVEMTSNKDVYSSLTNQVVSEDGNVDENISSGVQMEQEKTSTENVSSDNHCFEVKISNKSSHVDKNKKRLIKDKMLGQTKTNISLVKSSSRKAPIPEIHPRNQILKCNPREKISGQTKTEISLVKSSSRKAPIPEIHPKNQTLKHNPRVSTVNMVKKTSQVLFPRQESKRSKPLLDHRVNGDKTVVLKSHSTNHSETVIASTKKPRPITVPSSFSFKSDERAAKRKQFFQKLEEKPKLKEKARSDDKKLRWSTTREAKPSTSETKGAIYKIQKIMQDQATRMCQQKLGMKPKNFIEINKKKLSSSMACLPSKKSHD
ncbi:hypothetical protein SSX86_007223 [Deinandra increscens subsp. villosa]|uniref:TPX2 C-terminal domain-containing protein n=1 Tax=Deinandra increscens subsp. villosa TaxID=3103831 RepID=A0AAP0H9G2_9ASTR